MVEKFVDRGHQIDVATVTYDEAVIRLIVVRPRHASVLGEIVEADDFVTGVQQLLHEVAADKPGGAGDKDFHAGLKEGQDSPASFLSWS